MNGGKNDDFLNFVDCMNKEIDYRFTIVRTETVS